MIIFIYLFERADKAKSLDKFLNVHLFDEQKFWLWHESSSRSSNVAPEMSFAVALFCSPRYVS